MSVRWLSSNLPGNTEVPSLFVMSRSVSRMEHSWNTPHMDHDTCFDISILYMCDIAMAHRTLDEFGLVVIPSTMSGDDLDKWLAAMQAVDGNGLSERDPNDGTHYSYNTCRDLPIEWYRRLQSDDKLTHSG